MSASVTELNPSITASPVLIPTPPSPEYIQGVIEGYLAAQTHYRCLRPWHLKAMARHMEQGSDTVIKRMHADGTILRLQPSWMPGVFSLDGVIGYTTLRALQELAADTRRDAGHRTTVANYLERAGHPAAATMARIGDAATGFAHGQRLASPRSTSVATTVG